MPQPIKVLILEDRDDDARLMKHELTQAGFDAASERVDRKEDFLARLHPALDIILADFNLPGWNALEALEAAQAQAPEVPFIVVSGTIGEEAAVEAIRRGAADYLIKDRLGRLGAAVKQAIERRRLRAEVHVLEQAREAERRKASERMMLLSNALEAAGSAVMITLPDGTIFWVNRRFEALTGYKAGQAVGQKPRLLKSGRHDAIFYAEFWKKILSGVAWNGEFINKRKDGTLFQAACTVTPVLDGAEKITHFVSVMNDVTERHKTEERLERQATNLAAINADLLRFNRIAVGRELRMIEMKREINELCQQFGLPPRYDLDFALEQEKSEVARPA